MKEHVKPIHLIVASVAIIIVGGFAFATYSSLYQQKSDGAFAEMVSGLIPLPAARVGGQTVTYAEYLSHLKAQDVFLQGPTAQSQGLARELGTEDRVQAYERAIRIAAVTDMAEEAGLEVTPLDVDRTYQDLIARAGTSTSAGEIGQFLQNEFGWNIEQFKKYVVRPALIEDTLKQQRFTETQDALAFDRELAEKLNGEETKRYLSF